MQHGQPYALPSSPPQDLLDELDAAARNLDQLTLRAAELTLGMDSQAGGLRITLADDHGPRALTPTQLFELLTA